MAIAALPLRTHALPADALLGAIGALTGAGGALWLVVSGWSMTPLIRPGDRVLLERPGDPQVGDVLLVNCDGRAVLHRVTRVTATRVILRGDSPAGRFNEVSRSSVVARAVLLHRGTRFIALRPIWRYGVRAFAYHWLVRLWGRANQWHYRRERRLLVQ